MIDSSIARELALELIDKTDFGVPRNASMFELIREIASVVDDVDLVIVRSQVMQIGDQLRRDALDMVLSKIHHVLPNSASIEEYCTRLKQFTLKRKASAAIRDLSVNVGDNIAAEVARVADDLTATSSGAVIYGQDNEELEAELHDEFTGQRHYVAFAFQQLTNMTRALLPGTLTVICGSPGSSKSLFTTQNFNEWLEQQVSWAALELEDGTKYHKRRMWAQWLKFADVTDPKWVKENYSEIQRLLGESRAWLEYAGANLCEFHREENSNFDSAAEWVRIQVRKGKRVIVIDPFTLLDGGEKPWIAQQKFFKQVKSMLKKANASLVLVTHPAKQTGGGKRAGPATLDDIAGGAVVQRAAQTVLWLQTHSPKKSVTSTALGNQNAFSHNRTMYVLKARNSWGGGQRVAFEFDKKSLCMIELGLIVDDR